VAEDGRAGDVVLSTTTAGGAMEGAVERAVEKAVESGRVERATMTHTGKRRYTSRHQGMCSAYGAGAVDMVRFLARYLLLALS